jgi:hypothetical protein
MKYPRLEDKDNLSKKLTDKQIEEIQIEFKNSTGHGSPTSIRNRLAMKYKVSYATIYYWTNSNYRTQKRKENIEYWNMVKKTDYERWYKHKKDELIRRKNRMERNPKLKLWHEVISAKNEKRVKRKTVKGRKINEY